MHNFGQFLNSGKAENFSLALVVFFLIYISTEGKKKKKDFFSFCPDIAKEIILNTIIAQTGVFGVNGIKHPLALMEVSSDSSAVFQFLFTDVSPTGIAKMLLRGRLAEGKWR